MPPNRDSFYAYSRSLLPVCLAMAQRGLRVDNALREQRLKALEAEGAAVLEKVAPLVETVKPRLQERKLLWETKVCRGCRNGSKKRLTCPSCKGEGKRTTFVFNMKSQRQLADVLYNGLKLPRRSRAGHTTVDEEALKSLLALDSSGFVSLALRYAKLDTIREIYERLNPDSDSRVHSVFNIAGAYTGRFSSGEAFYVPHSTNLQNLPAEEGRRDPLFAVRECIVPDPGEVFVYADLSQAEARVSAVLSEDHELLQRWAVPTWDIHRWTGSHLFGKTEAGITAAERYLGKRCRHALNYGMGASKFWRTVNDSADLTGVAITLTEAKRIWTAYHALHPKLDQVWWNRVQRTLEARQPMVATHCGWTCPFWPRFEEGALAHESLRAAIAWEPQHTVVHVLNEGMRELYEQEKGQGYRVLLQGHDSVLLGVKKERWRTVAARAKRTLERPTLVRGYSLTIPAEVFVSEGSWANMRRVL